MNKLRIIALATVVAGSVGAADSRNEVNAAQGLPNIVLIFNDDLGYQDVGCFGSPDIKTPNVDQLAREGMRFTDFYVASPVCSASRAALMTGCYPHRVGVNGVLTPLRNGGLDPKYVTIAETLKSAGYQTAAVGKWHLGDNPKFLPTKQGFDSYYGIPYSNDMYPAKEMKYADDCLFREGFSITVLEKHFAQDLNKDQSKYVKEKVPLMRNEACIEFPVDQTTITRRYADEGMAFISKSVAAKNPFFLYLANSMPHTPLFTEEQFVGKSKQGPYGDAVEEIDFHVGRILDHLKKVGVDGNTIVIYTSDNGPWLNKGINGGSAKPLFEGKFTTFEGGMRVPFIIRWPGKIPANTVSSEMALSMDLHPTLAKLVGAEAPAGVDGLNIMDLWTTIGAKSPHDYFFYVNGDKESLAVRYKDWKYQRRERPQVDKTTHQAKSPTLYNLKNDIGESTNVIREHPEIAEQLDKALEQHLRWISEKL